jgi:hypothetical protein
MILDDFPRWEYTQGQWVARRSHVVSGLVPVGEVKLQPCLIGHPVPGPDFFGEWFFMPNMSGQAAKFP